METLSIKIVGNEYSRAKLEPVAPRLIAKVIALVKYKEHSKSIGMDYKPG